MLTIVQINVELSPSKNGLQDIAQICGYLLVCLSEPLLMASYVFKFYRIRMIFDAQKIYFQTGVRPSEIIKKYSEERLSFQVLVSVAILTAVYMTIGAISWGAAHKQGYGVLPTFAVGFATTNQHTFITLLVFVVATLCEGGLLAILLEKMTGIKREFSMVSELKLFCITWLLLTNLALFFVI